MTRFTSALRIAALLTATLSILLAASLTGCGDGEPIAIHVYAAVFDDNPQTPPPAGLQRVNFAGSLRSTAATILIDAEPLLTDWNIVAFRAAEESDGSRAISIRLNAYAQAKMKAYTAHEANLKRPLAVRVDDRWVDIGPLLNHVSDRMTLYGFSAEDVERLERAVASR